MSSTNLGPVVLDVKGLALDSDEEKVLASPMVGGLILFSRNYQSREQVLALIEQVRHVRPDIVVGVDQEGGRVQRFRDQFTPLPPMQALGRLCRRQRDLGLALSRDCGWLMAIELLSVGVDISFAPVLDLDDRYSKVIGDRSFGADPELVIAVAGAFMEGMHEAGMATTGKHFPGHGSVVADSHHELPVDKRHFNAISKRDLRPFKELRTQLDAIMPAHVLFPHIDDQLVGFSPHWLQNILRKQLGFDGVIFSDDLSMGGAATAGSYIERAELALAAGCDAILVCNNPVEAAAVVAHLERCGQPASPRLSRMRSRPPSAPAGLLTSERCAATREQLAQLPLEQLLSAR